MPVLGELQAKVQYGQQAKSLVLIVVAGDGPSLMGRNWLQHIQLDWKNIKAIAMDGDTADTLKALLNKHDRIFKDELGTIRPFQAKLKVNPEAQPRFCKPRPVPFAIKGAIAVSYTHLRAHETLRLSRMPSSA